MNIEVEIDKVNVSIDYKDISLMYRTMNSYNEIVKPALDNLLN